MIKKLLTPFGSLTRTTTFRVAMAFAGLFAGFAVLLLGFLYATTVGRLGLEADRYARNELIELSTIWQQQSIDGLNMEVIQRAAEASESLYVLVKPDGGVLSGNIDSAPLDLSQVRRPDSDAPLNPDGAVATGFSYERPEPESGRLERRRARGFFLAGPDGFGLFVARDLGPGLQIADQVARVIWMGGAGVLAFALIGGFLAARQVAGRVDELTQTTRAVMAGDLKRRAAVRTLAPGEGDEFDDLTDDLNAMLERIDRLVAAARTTGDAIAHDLRSPLTRLRTRLEGGALKAQTPSELRDVIEDAISQLDDVVATFNAVLRLSRLEAGEGGKLEALDVSVLVTQLAELFEPVIEEAGLVFTPNIQPGLMILADRSLLAQSISNLLDNAVKYTQMGEIQLHAKQIPANQVEISICDSGRGIPVDKRDYVLERFARLDNARSLPGSGIGLSLAVAIAELHGGRLVLSDGLAHEKGDGFGLNARLILPMIAP